jgi:hypothetical protein
MSEVRDALQEEHDYELIFLEPASQFDGCIVGVAERCGMPPCVVYERDRVIAALVERGMAPEDASEYMEFNIAGAYMGGRTPLILESTRMS